MFGDHFTRRFRSEFKVEMALTHEWYEFDVRKEGEKYYLVGDWEMFVNIYNLKVGDELCFHMGPILHPHLTVGHIRRLSGGFAMPRCTIGELCSHFLIIKYECILLVLPISDNLK